MLAIFREADMATRGSTGDKAYIDVEELVHETEMAWLFLINGEEVWMPKSQCDYDGETSLAVPTWLLEKKGIR
jgi:hypothetical protein